MILLAIAVALIVVRILAFMMNNVRRQADARVYERDFALTGQSDIYLYSHTTSRRIEKPSGGGNIPSSGGGSSRGGGGHSGGGGGRR